MPQKRQQISVSDYRLTLIVKKRIQSKAFKLGFAR